MDPLDNTGLIGCYTDDRIDQIIWSNPRTPSWNWNFGLKISASRVLWDIGFRLPGFFWILDFGFPGSLGYWISASRVLWDIGFRLPGFFGILDDRISLFDFWVNFFHFIQFIQHAIQLGDPELVIWGFEGPRCPFRNFDFNFRTQNLDSEFFLVALIQLLILFLLELGFFLGATNLEQLDLFFRTDLNLVSNDHSSGSMNLG
ncbi:unnamed protein product [Rhizophagus irregularis]|uniref:Uncharacterized protein n=1 Tax=Rhizophagus irregularis TaxID=588596 RepID=A0A915Z457_9GLOM|nr:unnamed protein product [Rhizophagus irregularis]CAB5361757.1 unnamed protein product [Rhizophagus irregularis]